QHHRQIDPPVVFCIGVCFLLAMILGPVLSHWVGVPGIFVLTAAFAVIGILVLVFYVPAAPRESVHGRQPAWRDTVAVLSNRELLRLDAGIFVLHAILTALFVAVPLALRDVAGLDAKDHWRVYLPVMLVSLAGTVPMIYFAERRGLLKTVFLL